jgi:hypothetical protein
VTASVFERQQSRGRFDNDVRRIQFVSWFSQQRAPNGHILVNDQRKNAMSFLRKI